ncbi:hypothetical protein [Photobacterium damselae]|uniref:Uncharacterized protein n=1 Tax=Photobacterium damselae subsp. damselae CIP 102761 TaxID=675817 RepID=D0Z5I3_PHODD|nr:hypothetical protein [Photobacterium damselae]EEZ38994.1 hypothetical protein VDA_000001 [Photobacterium damselae subsp. damselae CIP 102761]PSW79139.1 hypothetical protein CTN07_20910 [Photobacterium damselae]
MNNKNGVTTFIYRHKNYKNKAQIKRTLQHSLRIENTAYSVGEWNPNLTPKRALLLKPFFNENETHKLSSIKMDDDSLNEREHILNSMIDELFPHEATTKDKQDLTKYKAKLKKKIKETNLEPTLHEILYDTLDNPDESDFTQRINSLSNVKRKKQLLGMLTKYKQLHNLCKSSSDRRASKLHESFFKIPDHNGAVLSPQEIVSTLRSFYKKISPNYDIKLTVFHDDERLETTKEFVGAHVHVFLSCKNNVTQKYDLNKTLKQYVNNHLQLNPINFTDDATGEFIKINNLSSTYRDSKIYGSVMQDLFFNHLQERKPDINFGFTDDRSNRFNQRVDKYIDAKKRKSDRKFNYHNKMIKQYASLQKAITIETENLKKIEAEKNSLVADTSNFVIDIINSINEFINAVHNDGHVDTIKRKRNNIYDLIQEERYSIKIEPAVIMSLLKTIQALASNIKVNVTEFTDAIKNKFTQ